MPVSGGDTSSGVAPEPPRMASREKAVRVGRERHQLAIYDVEANDENEAEMKEAKRFAKVDPQDPWATVAEVMGIDPKEIEHLRKFDTPEKIKEELKRRKLSGPTP